MPSSLIFAGLVVLWLLILVPAVARHQQVVARPSVAALSGRVLTRPVRSTEEDDVQDTQDGIDERAATAPRRADGARADEDDHHARAGHDDEYEEYGEYGEDEYADHGDEGGDDRYDDRYDDEPEGTWERPAPRYRPGRGGFDPEAAELTARARYALRQRIVLALLVTVVLTVALALAVSPDFWWGHLAADLALVGYLVYLRRQVRMEEAIRARRAARMAGTRRPSSADDPALDEWARRGRERTRRPVVDDHVADEPAEPDDDVEELPETLDPDPDRVAGCGEPAGPLRDRPGHEEEPALPRLAPAPPPPPPAGTTLVEVDPDLGELDVPVRVDRRAAG